MHSSLVIAIQFEFHLTYATILARFRSSFLFYRIADQSTFTYQTILLPNAFACGARFPQLKSRINFAQSASLAAAFRPDLKSIFALEAYVCFGRAVCLNKMW